MKISNNKFLFLPAVLLVMILGLTACVHQENTPFSTTPSPTTPTYVSPTSAPISSTSLVASSETTPVSATSITRVLVIGDPVISELPDLKKIKPYSSRHIVDSLDKADNFTFIFQPSYGPPLNSPSCLNARYVSGPELIAARFLSITGWGYTFKRPDSDASFNIIFPEGRKYDLKLTPGQDYQLYIESDSYMGCYCLIICQGQEIVFAGITDEEIERTIKIGDAIFSASFPVFSVKLSREIADHYYEEIFNGWYYKYINQEIQFSLGGKSFTLHQGQTANLGDYRIDLYCANSHETRRVGLQNMLTDGGVGDFSFVLSRQVEARPAAFPFSLNEKVVFPDPVLDNLIRDYLGIQKGYITRMDLLGFFDFCVSDHNVNYEISDLSGLEKCLHLVSIYIDNSHIGDLSQFAWAPRLTYLSLRSDNITDMSSLISLQRLSSLDLLGNTITEIPDLSVMHQLTYLDLSQNQVTNFTGAASSSSLVNLKLNNNKIESIPDLSRMACLSSLDLLGNRLSDISGLAGAKRLNNLILARNKITNISALASLKELRKLELNSNLIGDISALSGLSQLTDLDLSGNQITDTTALAELKELRELFLSHNNLQNISGLLSLPNLTTLSLDSCKLQDISMLSRIMTNFLNLRDNQISDIKPLVDNPFLKACAVISLKGNPLSERSINEYIPQLKARGIIINY